MWTSALSVLSPEYSLFFYVYAHLRVSAWTHTHCEKMQCIFWATNYILLYVHARPTFQSDVAHAVRAHSSDDENCATRTVRGSSRTRKKWTIRWPLVMWLAMEKWVSFKYNTLIYLITTLRYTIRCILFFPKVSYQLQENSFNVQKLSLGLALS